MKGLETAALLLLGLNQSMVVFIKWELARGAEEQTGSAMETEREEGQAEGGVFITDDGRKENSERFVTT